MSVTQATEQRTFVSWRWLNDALFDWVFIAGLPAIATASAFIVVAEPSLFIPVLLFDLWFLGYHHVISTYTRLCFDRENFSKSKIMIFGLLPLVAIATVLVAATVGIWAIVSIYFYWQWFHYTRQSWGISRAYRAKDADADYDDGWIDQAIFYALPVLGILYRSYLEPVKFITMDLWVVPVAGWIVSVCAIATAALLSYWFVRRLFALRSGRLSGAHTLYMLTHFTIFAVGYLVIEDVTYGWLAINIWHNAQYILFVWLFNKRRFKDGVDPQAHFLSYISQPGRLWLYLLACILITVAVYTLLLGTVKGLFLAGLAGTLVVFQIVNFHHYIVDALIWKVRSKSVQQTLDLPG